MSCRDQPATSTTRRGTGRSRRTAIAVAETRPIERRRHRLENLRIETLAPTATSRREIERSGLPDDQTTAAMTAATAPRPNRSVDAHLPRWPGRRGDAVQRSASRPLRCCVSARRCCESDASLPAPRPNRRRLAESRPTAIPPHLSPRPNETRRSQSVPSAQSCEAETHRTRTESARPAVRDSDAEAVARTRD